uniref:Protein NUCLEAR FUSION DEFECTIVE 6, chloroplastic/mitochondrial-like n=1 Tax=Kalanchoe fedtschenkoi TaxID=63787 RepID=A0A7N0UTC4_KALFE
MAGSRLVGRLCSRLASMSPKMSAISSAPSVPPLKSAARSNASASAKRIFSNSRLPVELRCLGSMMPLHSAIASARLTSILSSESQSWGLIPQGNSMPL